MRLDREHVEKIERALHGSGDDAVLMLDIPFMRTAFDRLSVWERGLFAQAICRAVRAKRKTAEQRLILALFAHDDGGDDDTGK